MSKTDGASKIKVTFGKFARLEYEGECDGADILRDGLKIGTIRRNVWWDFKSASSRTQVSTVTGYKVEIGGFGTQLPDMYEEREFSSENALAAARAWAREMATK